MRIAICEDLPEDSARLSEMLSNYLRTHGFTADLEVFRSGKALLASFSNGMYQIVFQDIYMEKNALTGVQTAEKIREIDSEVAIIFITTSHEHGPESYDVGASYYIIKPLKKEDLEKAMEKCYAQLDRYARTIEVVENRQPVKIRLRDICYAEVIGHNSLLHTVSGKIRTRIAFCELAEKLKGSPFLSCHRSYIVNLTHVADLKGKEFIMKNGHIIPVSKTYHTKVQDTFRAYFWGD